MSAIDLQTMAQNLNIATWEQGIVYMGMLGKQLYPNLKVEEVQNADRLRVCEYNVYTMPDGTLRAIIRASIQMNANHTSDRSKKQWMFAEEIDQVIIPAGFLSN